MSVPAQLYQHFPALHVLEMLPSRLYDQYDFDTASMAKSFSKNSYRKDIADLCGHQVATRLCRLHVMHACRFAVCLAFVFGDVRSMHVNVDSCRRCCYGTC